VLKAATLIAEGLWNTHRVDVVHRDLKPDNILVEEDKESGVLNVVVIDFGFAKDTAEYKGQKQLWSTVQAAHKLPIESCKYRLMSTALGLYVHGYWASSRSPAALMLRSFPFVDVVNILQSNLNSYGIAKQATSTQTRTMCFHSDFCLQCCATFNKTRGLNGKARKPINIIANTMDVQAHACLQ
jgi:serine/threonine protein kinase